jgi:hypothetical protein
MSFKFLQQPRAFHFAFQINVTTPCGYCPDFFGSTARLRGTSTQWVDFPTSPRHRYPFETLHANAKYIALVFAVFYCHPLILC